MRRAEPHRFDDKRHRTLSLYAEFTIKTGGVIGETAARHTSAELVSFLKGSGGQAAARQRDPRHRGQSRKNRGSSKMPASGSRYRGVRGVFVWEGKRTFASRRYAVVVLKPARWQ